MARKSFQEQLELAIELLPKETLNTVYMVLVSTVLACIIGLFLAIVLVITKEGGIKSSRVCSSVLEFCVNMSRSIPFAILIVAIIPFTRWVVGTSLGTTATIVPLTIAAIAFVTRVFEQAFLEIPKQLIDASIVMGAKPTQVITMVYIKEALPSLIKGATLTAVNLIGYSAMAGMVGGGGLGKIAIQYGYQRFNGFLMLLTLLVLIALVQFVQSLGNWLSTSCLKKRALV